MSKDQAAVIARKQGSKNAFEGSSQGKPFHQYFSRYFIAILLACGLALSIALVFLVLQSKQSQAVINKQLAPLQLQFLQQSYLHKTNLLIDDILLNVDVSQLVSLHEKLSLQSKNLSLLNSHHQDSYQQWFINNNTASNLVATIESSSAKAELLKNKTLMQLDTLLDAIAVQFKKGKLGAKQAQQLSKLQQQLSSIVTVLKRLDLQTTQDDFKQLSTYVDKVFLVDVAKKLARKQQNDQAMMGIVRDFIRFEDMILKQGLLVKWQQNLQLMDDYRQLLVSQQKQLQSIVLMLSEGDFSGVLLQDAFSQSDSLVDNKKALAQSELPRWLFGWFAITFVIIAVLLWIILLRIKVSSRRNVDYICHALESSASLQENETVLYCAEAYLLVDKIQQFNSNRSKESEFLILFKQKQELEKQLTKERDKLERLKLEFIEFKAFSKSKSQLSYEQKYYKSLNLASIQQQLFLGHSALADSIHNKTTHKLISKEDYLLQAHLQGQNLAEKLKQASCYHYFQTSNAVLTLSDVNLIAQIETLLLNLRSQLLLCQNKISLRVDENILSEVNLDIELFSEMFSAFIQLLLSQQSESELFLQFQLVDRNSGQQKITFSGEVQATTKAVQLPKELKSLNDIDTENSELAEYFTRLLKYQHGENANASLTSQGYQLSFSLPIGVTSNKKQQSYPEISLPLNLPAIEQDMSKLHASYLAMPIEVLLAVKSPIQYQRLQQLLQAMGLQVTFVSCDLQIQKYWQSGRFAVLITEINCTAFIRFMVDEIEIVTKNQALVRGVFKLNDSVSLAEKEQGNYHWQLGELTNESTVNKLITLLQPWIKEQASIVSSTDKVVETKHTEKSEHFTATKKKAASAPVISKQGFNFERYIHHQGSAELALFMLEEYTAENTMLIEHLSKAFSTNNTARAKAIIKALTVNSKILSARELLHLCQHWERLLIAQGLDNSQRVQTILFSKTKHAVEVINRHADAVV